MTLRPATGGDELLFLEWRLKAEARGREGGWYIGPDSTRAGHADWYSRRLGVLGLFVWVHDGAPQGCVRVESNGEVTAYADSIDLIDLLREVKSLAAESTGKRFKVTVDKADTFTAAALDEAGWTEYPARFYAHHA